MYLQEISAELKQIYYGGGDAANQFEEEGTKETGADKACLGAWDIS